MKLIFGIILLLGASAIAQELLYSPGQTQEYWINYDYYDTEFIFIQNNSTKSLDLNFENTVFDIPNEWLAGACTNVECYPDMPESGSLGTLLPGEEAYFSINLTTNQTVGDGTIEYVITESAAPENGDTLRFIYHANEYGSIEQGPWTKVNYFEDALTIFLRDAHVAAKVRIFDLQGNTIIDERIEEIYSYRLGDHPFGMYVLVIEDELGRVHKERLINI